MNQYGYGRQTGYGIPTGYGVSTGYAAMGPMAGYASNPQMVQQHISQDLGYAPSTAMQTGYAGGQRVGYQPPGYQPIQNQQYYNPAAFGQVMGSVHDDMAQIRQQIQQDIQYGNQPPTHYGHGGSTYTTSNVPYGSGIAHGSGIPNGSGVPYGSSTLSQYGSDAQMVRSHIHQDLQNGQGAITSAMAGAMHGGPQGYSHTTSPMHTYGTNPQMVQQQIHSDLHAPQHAYGYGTSMMAGMGATMNAQMSTPMGSHMGSPIGTHIASPMHAGATNPQNVRQQIQHDLGRQAYYS